MMIRNASYTQDVTAGKLLQQSTLYNLGSNVATRVFFNAAQRNNRDRMFDVPGRHTFFLPVDEAFKIVDKEYINAKVVEAHIIPGQLLITSLIPTQEYGTVAYSPDDTEVRVNVSMQPSLEGGSVMVRSNTIVGDRVHPPGLVVSRIVKGNIPVQNGIVHLIVYTGFSSAILSYGVIICGGTLIIFFDPWSQVLCLDKPLMIVTRSLYDYVMEEGRDPNNRLYSFAQLILDKGGIFAEAIREEKEGTLLAPSNEAFRKVDRNRLDYILAHRVLREEFFGLHYTRERISSNKNEIMRTGERMYSAPALKPVNNIYFRYNKLNQVLSVEGRGINATAVEKDIGTINGVIHVIDHVLGVPSLTVADKLRQDPTMSHSRSLTYATGLMDMLARDMPNKKFTFMVPSNEAWEKVKRDLTQAFVKLTDLNYPEFAINTLRRHLIITDDRGLSIEELAERSRRNPSQTVDTEAGGLKFTRVELTDKQRRSYWEWYVEWKENVKGKIVRPNLECTNGYIHLIDTVMMDDQEIIN